MPFHCHRFAGQRGSFNVFSWPWFPTAMGFFQCLFIVMASQGSGVLSKSVIVMVSQGNGILKAVGFFISMSFHGHGFTGQWDSEGSGILYQCLFIVMVSQGNGILRAAGFFISMSFHCHGFTGHLDSSNVLPLSL